MTKAQVKNNIGFKDKLHAYLFSHLHAFFSSLGRLVASPVSSIMTVIVLAVAIALAASFYMVVANAKQLTGSIEASNQLSVFLKASVNEQQGREFFRELQQHSNIQSLSYISKQQALQEFKAQSGFGAVLEILSDNPLPIVIQALPKDSLKDNFEIKALATEIGNHPQVDVVQLDMDWLRRLQAIMQMLGRGVMLINALLAIAVIFITGNTIRLELQNRKDEVLIAKLVGATHAFVQRPFIYTGFWIGLAAGLCAWLILLVLLWTMQGPVEQLSLLYYSQFDLLFPNLLETLTIIFSSSLLGVLGAWSVLLHQLNLIKPQ